MEGSKQGRSEGRKKEGSNKERKLKKVLTLSFLSQRNLSLWALLCMKTPSR